MNNVLNTTSYSDIVFCIFLYQRWIYRVDPTRVNEFGTTGEPAKEAIAAPEAAEVKSEESKKSD